jgi:hypothetical protein
VDHTARVRDADGVIGSPLSIGQVSEVVPVAPRADVRAPLVMERLLMRDPQLFEATAEIADLARTLPAAWQRLVSAELSNNEAQLIYERFVGITLRDLSVALRTTGRVLPLDVLRAVIERTCDGLSALPTGPRAALLSDRSIGLAIDGQWRFALGALNHWLVNLLPPELAADPEFDAMSPDTIFFMSPEGISGRPETPASLVSRAALFAWQVTTGGFHPFRGGRYEMMPSITRYTRDEVRVPVSVHPDATAGLAEVLLRGVSFSRNRFADLGAFRAALDATWPVPAASPARTLEVIASLTWSTMQKELQLLKREPMLPIRWDGVWSASRTPEEGIAVLEDQLLERLEPIERFKRRGAIEDPGENPPAPQVPQPFPPAPPRAPPRAGLLERFLALFRR